MIRNDCAQPGLLLEQPDLVAESWLGFAAALWFLVTPQPPKPSMLSLIDRSWQPNQADRAAGLGESQGRTLLYKQGNLLQSQGSALLSA